MQVHDFHFDTISGSNLPLGRFRGQPILLINTATESQFSPQLRKLQRLWENYRHCGLVIIGLPCNDFGEREPRDNAEIDALCRNRFGVRFHMTAKQSLNGNSINPLFQALRETYGREAMPRWNFYKYLFDVRGRLVERWASRMEPDDPHVVHQIERHARAWII